MDVVDSNLLIELFQYDNIVCVFFKVFNSACLSRGIANFDRELRQRRIFPLFKLKWRVIKCC